MSSLDRTPPDPRKYVSRSGQTDHDSLARDMSVYLRRRGEDDFRRLCDVDSKTHATFQKIFKSPGPGLEITIPYQADFVPNHYRVIYQDCPGVVYSSNASLATEDAILVRTTALKGASFHVEFFRMEEPAENEDLPDPESDEGKDKTAPGYPSAEIESDWMGSPIDPIIGASIFGHKKIPPLINPATGFVQAGWIDEEIPSLDDDNLVTQNPASGSTTSTPDGIPIADGSGKIDNGWLNTGTGNGLDADTVDGAHASATPTGDTIPVANGSGKIDNGWLNTGTGNGIDADSVDGADASTTPTADTIPIANGSGKIDNGWLDTGTGNGLDADTVDGADASTTPTADTIPIANGSNKIDNGWLNTGSGGGIDADRLDGAHGDTSSSGGAIPIADPFGKISNDWLNTGSGGGIDADSVDGADASTTPTADTIPIADGSGKLASGWLPAGVGDVVGPASSSDDRIVTFDGITGKLIQDSGYPIGNVALSVGGSTDGNLVTFDGVTGKLLVDDGLAVDTTPTADKIPQANGSGKIANGWLNTGTGNGIDADSVDGADASATAAANTIPISLGTGQLDTTWVNVVNGYAAVTDIRRADSIVIYDNSSSGHRKITWEDVLADGPSGFESGMISTLPGTPWTGQTFFGEDAAGGAGEAVMYDGSQWRSAQVHCIRLVSNSGVSETVTEFGSGTITTLDAEVPFFFDEDATVTHVRISDTASVARSRTLQLIKNNTGVAFTSSSFNLSSSGWNSQQFTVGVDWSAGDRLRAILTGGVATTTRADLTIFFYYRY